MKEIDKKLWNAKTVEEVSELFQQGADVKVKDKFGLAALCYAQSAEIAKVFIVAGADINAKDDDGETAFIYAKNGNRFDVADFIENYQAG